MIHIIPIEYIEYKKLINENLIDDNAFYFIIDEGKATKETIIRVNLIIKTLMYGLPYKLNDDTIVTMIDNELYFRGEDLDGNEVWSKCIFELTLNDLIKQAENMSEEYAFELTANIVLFEKKFKDKK